MSKSYSLFINSQNAKNRTSSSSVVAEESYIINWDTIFRDEPSTQFEMQYALTTPSFAGGDFADDVLLSINLPTNRHFSQTGSSSMLMGRINLRENVTSDLFRADYSDNFGITINRPTDNQLIIKFLKLDETPLTAFPNYILILKFTPII